MWKRVVGDTIQRFLWGLRRPPATTTTKPVERSTPTATASTPRPHNLPSIQTWTSHDGITKNADLRYSNAATPLERDAVVLPHNIHDLTSFVAHLESLTNRLYGEFGEGHLEKVYHRSLVYRLRKLATSGLQVHVSSKINIFDEHEWVGSGYPDLMVQLPNGEKLVIEIKRVNMLAQEHVDQLLYYMDAFKINTGLLINFPSVQRFPALRDRRPQVQVVSGIDDTNGLFTNPSIVGEYFNQRRQRQQQQQPQRVQIVKVHLPSVQAVSGLDETTSSWWSNLLMNAFWNQPQPLVPTDQLRKSPSVENPVANIKEYYSKQHQSSTCRSPKTGAKACQKPFVFTNRYPQAKAVSGFDDTNRL